ncbi:MAG: glycosyltransferase [Clostridia bacterium]|nr:glycosyltransferase [Clostridia bacterium]
MKIVQLNCTCGIGSTGKICVGISEKLTAKGIENHILHSGRSSGYPLGLRYSTDNYIRSQALRSRVLGNYGFNSVKATRELISNLERLSPDIVHLHNIHSHDCNLETLFSYFKDKGTRLVWTFHDCWAFTGYCTHFTMAGCDKWKSRCHDCVQKREYSWFFDKSGELFDKKKRLLQGLDMTIVTPSEWLAGLVKQSFLKNYPVQVIHNGIDLDIFKPTDSDFRSKRGLCDKRLVLGVSFDWGRKKGLDVFSELARRLPDDYRIVLIGTDDAVDAALPDNIISVHRTQDQRELAQIYSAADAFVNPTREENYPTVNMEALACGTPVITFNTGGSPEIIDECCGSAVECDDVDALEKEILRVCEDRPFSREACVKKALAFDKGDRYEEYVKLYERIVPSGDERD